MECSGRVIEVQSDIARVLIEKGACDQCRSCALYSTSRKRDLVVSALNRPGAEVGDLVYLTVSGKKVMWASAVLFLVPLAGLLAGYAIGSSVISLFVSWSPEALGIIFGFLLLGISYIPVRMLGKRTSFEFLVDSVAGHAEESGKLTQETEIEERQQ